VSFFIEDKYDSIRFIKVRKKGKKVRPTNNLRRWSSQNNRLWGCWIPRLHNSQRSRPQRILHQKAWN